MTHTPQPNAALRWSPRRGRFVRQDWGVVAALGACALMLAALAFASALLAGA